MTRDYGKSYVGLECKHDLDKIPGMSDMIEDERVKLLLSGLKAQYESLKGRGQDLATALQKAVPFSALPGEHLVEQQKEFLLAFADFRLLQKLFETGEATVNGINLEQVSSDEIETGSFVETLASLAQNLIDTIVHQFGVSKGAVMPAVIKDFEQQIEMIATVVERAEKRLKAATA